MQQTVDSKELLVQADGFIIRIEYTNEHVIVHLRHIDKFTKEVFREMQYQLTEWSQFIKAMGHEYIWAAVPFEETKIKRLVGGLGFTYTGQNNGMTVYRYEV